MTSSVITEIPMQEDEKEFIAWMDWRGPDVLRLLHDGKVDVIHWGITDTERFEKVKTGRGARDPQRVLCVTGPHPEQDTPTNPEIKPGKSWGTRTVRVDPEGLVLNFFSGKYRPSGPRSRYDVGDRVYIERDKHDANVVWVGNANPREMWVLEGPDGAVGTS